MLFDGFHLFVLVHWPVLFSAYHELFGVSLSFAFVLPVMLSFAFAATKLEFACVCLLLS